MKFYSRSYKKVELFIRKTGKRNGTFLLECAGKRVFGTEVSNELFHRVTIVLSEHTAYHVVWENSQISQMYLCGNEEIEETGIEYLIVNNEQPQPSEVLDTPYREQFHFTPYVNWNNDPNGLCWMNGKYHLYYQANPHDQKWDNMYWGHAVSTDLVHWKHLPYALEPQAEILASSDLIGGAFSGSAVVLPEGMRIFFTRDIEKRGGAGDVRQSQATAWSTDGISFVEEKEILPAYAVKGIDMNFRDPKVNRIEDKWYMVVASNYCGKGSVLLFSSEDMIQWSFCKPLLQEEDPQIPSMECPDFFPLDNTWVLLASVMGVRTKYGVYQPVMYYTGEWKNETFTVQSREVCDFGCNFYAPQTLEHDGKRIMIAWICDWAEERIATKHGACGGFTLPRELSIRDGKLYQKPIDAVYALQREVLLEWQTGKFAELEIPGNSYYCCMEFNGKTEFAVTLFDDGSDFLRVVGKKSIVELQSSKSKDKQARYIAEIEKLEKLEIFMDRRTVELYINDGEKAGTKIFMYPTKTGRISFWFANEDRVSHVIVRRMEAIWGE
ncbi:MAG: GH32 C-terminal domain-containing protein [Lachnospiraceae bacterium]